MPTPAPTVTLTIAGKPVEVKFTLLKLADIETRMGFGLPTIINDLRAISGLPIPTGEPLEEGGNKQPTQADFEKAAENARLAPRLALIAACVGQSVEELADAIAPNEVTNAFLPAFMGLLNATTMLVPQDPEKAEEGTPEVPTSAASAPGPA